ncbi:MAG: Septum site-determining protein MinD [bacterium ADurb.Bin429]|nr:MAG: Septum site-determining protein MinD [bacterium ADurb.Bin429]
MTDCSSCRSPQACDTCVEREETLEEALARIEHDERLRRIRHTIIIMSGKGGVGKSTLAVNFAMSLAMAGRRVGLLDIDLHGPSIPTMLNLVGTRLEAQNGKLVPAGYELLKVLSVGFLLEDQDAAVIWRGPAKAGVIKQFIEDVEWGELDYLIIDCPPGTGDEPLSVVQTLGHCDGAVIVTTPQAVALADVRKSVTFCRKLNVPVLGVVENMSGLVCPHCQQVVTVFKTGGGERLAAAMLVPFLGRVPLDPALVTAGDDGHPYVHRYGKSPTASLIEEMALSLLNTCEGDRQEQASHITPEEAYTMRIAIPLAAGQLCLHFGHCEQFALVDVDAQARTITNLTLVTPPPHEPGLLPRWLHEQGTTAIIAGGMGARAQGLFAEQGITVVTGAPVDAPEVLVRAYLDATLATGENTCDH